MSWNTAHHQVELVLENHGSAKKPKLRFTGFVRHTQLSGETYLEPMSDFWRSGLKDMEFAGIDIVQPGGTNRTANAGELALTRLSAGGRFGGRKA